MHTTVGKYDAETSPLHEGTKCRIIPVWCGRRRPLCRWDSHLLRLAGAPTPASCRIFVFHVDYSKNFSTAQEFLETLVKKEAARCKRAVFSALSPLLFDGISFQYMVFFVQRLYDSRRHSGGQALKEVLL